MAFRNFVSALRCLKVKTLHSSALYRYLIQKSTFASADCCSRIAPKKVRIGCASGFWGDTNTSVPQLVHYGNLQFLVFDYLSEITMSLLVAARKKSPDLGYTPDFIYSAMIPNLKEIKRQGIKVISNAGGINPYSCAKALREAACKQNLQFKIGVITGDDLMPQKETVASSNIKEMSSGLPLPKSIHSMNTYMGAGPIARALDLEADIVITGRCVDSALVLGPLINTFKWKNNDWDKLSIGSLAGHLIECGAQSTGGIFTDWHKSHDWDNIGFPVVECSEDGKFLITKPPNTGGLVTTGTVAEQLLYEIGDPKNYILPDVICDFSQVTIQEIAENVVSVEGAKGHSPFNMYKVCATHSDGFRATALCPVIGPRAVEKATKTADAILKRSRTIFKKLGLDDFKRTHMEVIGSNQSVSRNQPSIKVCQEVVLWLAVHHNQRQAVEIFTHEIATSATSAAPGLTSLVGGRPHPVPVLKLFSFLYPKEYAQFKIDVDGVTEDYVSPQLLSTEDSRVNNETVSNKEDRNYLKKGQNSYRLEDLAYTRSGDKGNTANIGVISRHPVYFPYLIKELTSEAVFYYFRHLFDVSATPKNVKRYTLPGIHALNFVLEEALGGGGIASLRSDPQGKALGQILLDFPIENMPNLGSLMK